jgi:predicted RNase H-like nuclease (RuvC/YqgF family)
MLARSKHLEDSLIALCGEKSLLESELSKMSAGSGRSLKERRRKAEVQQRLETLGREISNTRMQLKKVTGKWTGSTK